MGSVLHLRVANSPESNNPYVTVTLIVNSTIKYLLSYKDTRDTQIKAIVKQYLVNSSENHCILFADKILKPNQPLK